MRRLLLLAMAPSLLACGPVDEVEAVVEHANCRQDDDIRVCIEHDRYGPGDSLPYTITNVGDERAYENRCNGSVEGRRNDDDAWSGSFGYVRICAYWPEEADVRHAMALLEPGVPVGGTLHVGSRAYEGEWRLSLHVLDRNAQPRREAPYSSPVFRVLD